jgi:hypothetical protein
MKGRVIVLKKKDDVTYVIDKSVTLNEEKSVKNLSLLEIESE